MDCAEFDRRLAALLGDEGDPARREAEFAALRSHAGSCPACRGGRDLIDVAGAAGDPELLDAPPSGYWDGFEDRLRVRIAREPARPGTGGGGVRRWLAAAALLVVMLGGFWGLRRGGAPATDPGRPGPFIQTTEGGDPGLPAELDELLSRVPHDEALRQLDFLEGFGGDWTPTVPGVEEAAVDSAPAGWVYPDTAGLDNDGRHELLEWLRREGETNRRTRS